MFLHFNSQNIWPYHRGVMLRNIFNPMRGPKMSPAPNSTCRNEYTPVEWGLFRKHKFLFLQIKTDKSSERSFWTYFPPALSRHNSAYGHVNVAPSTSIVRGQRTRQHGCVIVSQRSLKTDREMFLRSTTGQQNGKCVCWCTSIDWEICILFISMWGKPPPGNSSKSSS